MYPWLRKAQDYLLRSVGKKRIGRVDRDTATRNAYCYFLSTTKKLAAPDVAKIVFPGKRRAEAIAQVRVILSQFRARLKSVGISDERKR